MLMSEIQAGQVTVADLYKEVVQVRQDIGTVAIGVRLAEERHVTNTSIHDDHERRLRALERAWWKVAGAAAVLSAAVSLLTAWLTLRGR
jgi:hypothetical protein